MCEVPLTEPVWVPRKRPYLIRCPDIIWVVHLTVGDGKITASSASSGGWGATFSAVKRTDLTGNHIFWDILLFSSLGLWKIVNNIGVCLAARIEKGYFRFRGQIDR